MKHNDDGNRAEEAVADYLVSLGYKIRDRNWKTKQCEVDIVAEKTGCIYFVEVKYRSNESQGSGFDYITSAKQRQMAFAADYWVAQNRWTGEYVLSGAEVSGHNYAVEFIEEI